MTTPVRRVIWIALLAAACVDRVTTTDDPAQSLLPSAVRVIAGDSQTALVHTTLPTRVRFRVLNDSGRALRYQTIDLVVEAWRGGALSATSLVTDSLGEAGVEWTVGTVAGTQTLEARVATPTGPVIGRATAFGTPGPLAFTRFGVARAHVLGDSVWAAPVVSQDVYGNHVPPPAILDVDGLGTTQLGDSTLTITAAAPGRFRFAMGTDTLVVVVVIKAGPFRLVHYRGDTIETLTGDLVPELWMTAGGPLTEVDTSFVYHALTNAVAKRSIAGVPTDSVRFDVLPRLIYAGIPWIMGPSGAYPWYGRWTAFAYHDVVWPDGRYDALKGYQVALTGPGRWTARGLQVAYDSVTLGPKDTLTIR